VVICPDRRRDVVLVGAGADEVEPVVAAPRAAHQARDLHLAHGLGHLGEGPERSAFGISSNSCSMSVTPMAASMSWMSVSVWGLKGITEGV
jgi:hypothetical protein